MTSQIPPSQQPTGPRSTPADVARIVVSSVLTAFAGWLTVHAFTSGVAALDRDDDGRGLGLVVLGVVSCVLVIGTFALVLATGTGEPWQPETGPRRSHAPVLTLFEVVTLWSVAVLAGGWLGAGGAGGDVWLWGIAVALAVLVVGVVPSERGRRAAAAADLVAQDRAWRIERFGREVPGKVVGISETGSSGSGGTELDVTVRFAVGGTEHTALHRDSYAVHEMAALRDGVVVRYDPEDPAQVEVRLPPLDGPGSEVPPDATVAPDAPA